MRVAWGTTTMFGRLARMSEAPQTGNERVDAALSGLAGVADLGLDERFEALAAAQDALASVLDVGGADLQRPMIPTQTR